jgi:hypothetical protein
VILVARISQFHAQRYNGNLHDQERNLIQEVLPHGVVVVDIATAETSGTDPAWIAPVAAKAKAIGATLVFESTDRAIRHPDYHSKKRPNKQARETDLEELAFYTLGVPLVTILHPDVTPTTVRSYQRKRGQQQKGRCGGRPRSTKPGDKKRRREELLSTVLEMHEFGSTVTDICRETKLPRMTVSDWIRKHA